jgi:hypothetical protein
MTDWRGILQNSWTVPRRGQPKAVEKIFILKILDCGGVHHDGRFDGGPTGTGQTQYEP